MRSLLMSLLLLCAIQAAEPAQPHIHQGRLESYDGPPPTVDLTVSELEILARDEPVKRQLKTGEGGRAVAVQDIHASPEIVWDRILDYRAYPQMVENVHETEIYERSGEHIKVRFVIGALLMSIEYYIEHTVHPEQGWVTWTLDYSRESELDDSVGFWRVESVADRPGYTRVFYSVEVFPRGWVPEVIEDFVTDRGLTKATAWVKRESEAQRGTSQ